MNKGMLEKLKKRKKFAYYGNEESVLIGNIFIIIYYIKFETHTNVSFFRSP